MDNKSEFLKVTYLLLSPLHSPAIASFLLQDPLTAS